MRGRQGKTCSKGSKTDVGPRQGEPEPGKYPVREPKTTFDSINTLLEPKEGRKEHVSRSLKKRGGQS